MKARHILHNLKKQRGQALPMILLLLCIGSLSIVTLLGFIDFGIQTGQDYKDSTRLRYAADAGLEDALWKTENEEMPFLPDDYETAYEYTLEDPVNNHDVAVNIHSIWPLQDLESDVHGTERPDSLTVTGGIINPGEGKYKVQISYDGSRGDLPIDKVAVWLPTRFGYVSASTTGMTTDDPTITYNRGGKILTWDFSPAVDFLDLPDTQSQGGGFLPGVEYPASRKLYFNVTPVDEMAGGSFSWVRTTDASLYLAWETGCTIYQVSSVATDNATGETVSLGGYTYHSEGFALGDGGYQVRGGYRAFGDSLMQTDGDPRVREILLDESTVEVTDIPGDAEVVLAYLYWSAWKDFQGSMVADEEIYLKIDDRQVYFDGDGLPVEGTGNITASKYYLLENNSPDYSYSCFLDVTDLVKLISLQGNTTYTVGGIYGDTGGEWSYAGWSLVLFYTSQSEPIRQTFLYDQFMFAGSYDTHTFEIEGFVAPPEADAVLTVFVGEGDEHYGCPHWFTGYDWIKFNGNYLSDAVNPYCNVWNGLSSGLGGQSIDGVDIDGYNVSSPIINQGDTSATVQLGTGVDNWNLIYILLSFKSEYGGLAPNTSGIISYNY